MGTADNLHQHSVVSLTGIHGGIEQCLGRIRPQRGRRDKSRNQIRHQRFSRRPYWFVATVRHSGASAATTLSQRTPDQLAEISGTVSGPITNDRTHFLISAEYNDEKRDSVITTPLAPGVFRGIYHQELLMGRVDHKLNSRNTLSGRFNFDNFIDTNPQDNVGVNTLPSAARTFRRRGYLIQAAENTLFKPTLVNDLRFELLFGSPITRFDPATPSIQLVRSGVLASTEIYARQLHLV